MARLRANYATKRRLPLGPLENPSCRVSSCALHESLSAFRHPLSQAAVRHPLSAIRRDIPLVKDCTAARLCLSTATTHRVAHRKRKTENGKRKAESGKRKAESGKRKAESGKRKAESGRSRRLRRLLLLFCQRTCIRKRWSAHAAPSLYSHPICHMARECASRSPGSRSAQGRLDRSLWPVTRGAHARPSARKCWVERTGANDSPYTIRAPAIHHLWPLICLPHSAKE